MDKVGKHEEQLDKAGLKRFKELETHGVRRLGPTKASEKVGVFSFLVPGVRHELVSAILNHEHAIATRNGCFCAQPLVSKLLGIGSMGQFASAMARGEAVELPGATRATLGIYNTEADVDATVEPVGAMWKAAG